MAQNSNNGERNQTVPRALVTQPPERLVCSICQELFHEPVIISCFHSFCSPCLQNWKAKKTDCPLCRSNITSTQKHILVAELIEELVVYCRYGVKETSNNNVRFGQIGEHFAIVPNGCTVKMPIKNIAAHEKECPFQMQAKYGSYLETIAVLKKNLRTLEASHKNLKYEKTQLQEENKKLQEGGYKRERNQLLEDNRKLRAENKKLGEENKKLAEENKAYGDDYAELESEIDELKNNNWQWWEGNEEGEMAYYSEYSEEYEDMERECEQLKFENARLAEENQKLGEENQGLYVEYGELEEFAEGLEKTNDRQKKKIEELENQVSELKNHGHSPQKNAKRRRSAYDK